MDVDELSKVRPQGPSWGRAVLLFEGRGGGRELKGTWTHQLEGRVR